MRLDPGSYRASRACCVSLMQSNSTGSRFSSPRVVEEIYLNPGKQIEIPETIGPYYYSAEERDLEPVPAATEAL